MARERLWDEAERQTTCLMDWEIPATPALKATATVRMIIPRSFVSPRSSHMRPSAQGASPLYDAPTPVLLARECFQKKILQTGGNFNKHIARSANGSAHFASLEDTPSCRSCAIYNIKAALIGEKKTLP